MNLFTRFRRAADAIADFAKSEEQRYHQAARLWWLWRHEYLAAKQIDPQGVDLPARAHLAAFGEDAHTLDTFDRFYRACLNNARTLAPADTDRTQIEPELIRQLIEDAVHGFFPVAGNTTYQIDPPRDDPRQAAPAVAIPEKRTYGLAAAILLAGLLAIWLILPDSAPLTTAQAGMVASVPGAAPPPTPEPTPTPAPLGASDPSWGSLAHGAVGNDPYDRAPVSLELGARVYRVYAAEVYPGEPWQADPQPGVALWLAQSYANIILCISDHAVIEEVTDGDTIIVRTNRSDVLRFVAQQATPVARHETEVFDQRRAGITILPCTADGEARSVVRGTY